MKAILTTIALCLGLCLPVVAAPQAFAYEFSAAERALADNPTLNQSNSVPQWQRDEAQARQQSQENDRLHSQVPQFNPREFDPPNPYNLYQPGGRAQVCRRGANNAVHCY